MAKGVQSHSGGSYDGSAQFDLIQTDPFQGPIQLLTGTTDVINIDSNLGNNYICTNASADAITLSRVPVAGVDDGLTIAVWASTNVANKITTTALLQTGVTGSKNSVAMAAFAGAGFILRAYNGFWQVVGSNGALTFAQNDPLKDRVLIEVLPPPTKIGGIFLPDIAVTNKTAITGDISALPGKVIAVGPGKMDDEGEFHATEVQPGDLVWVSSRWNDLPQYSETMRLMQEQDILGYRSA